MRLTEHQSTSLPREPRNAVACLGAQMAPEVIRSDRYNQSADVFSFAVLVQCLLSQSDYPYHDAFITPAQAALGVAKHGLRPNLSKSVPIGLQQIVRMSWAPDASSRPSMDVVVAMLTNERKRLSQGDGAGREGEHVG